MSRLTTTAFLAFISAVAGPSIVAAQAPIANPPEPYVCLPKGPQAVAPHPLIIWNHGRAHSSAEYQIVLGAFRKTCEIWAATLNAIIYFPIRPDRHGSANIPPELDLVMAAIDHAKALPDVDQSRIALMGQSRGGLLAMMAAVRRTDIAAVVLTAAPEIQPHTRDTVARMAALTAPVLLMVEKSDDEGGLDGFAIFSRALKAAGKEHRAILFDKGGGHGLFRVRDYWWDDFETFLVDKVGVTPSAGLKFDPTKRKKIEMPPPDPNRRKR